MFSEEGRISFALFSFAILSLLVETRLAPMGSFPTNLHGSQRFQVVLALVRVGVGK
jgi:hypothetical protein